MDTTLTQMLQEVVDVHIQLQRAREDNQKKDVRIAELEKENAKLKEKE